MSDLYKAIRARLAASSDGAFRGDKVYAMRAPPGVAPAEGAKPTVVFSLSWTADDTFESDGRTIQIIVTISDHIGNGTDPLFAAYARVRGDSAPPDTAPTYGLHRHPLTLASGNEADLIVETGADELYSEDPAVIGLVIRYETSMDQVVQED